MWCCGGKDYTPVTEMGCGASKDSPTAAKYRESQRRSSAAPFLLTCHRSFADQPPALTTTATVPTAAAETGAGGEQQDGAQTEQRRRQQQQQQQQQPPGTPNQLQPNQQRQRGQQQRQQVPPPQQQAKAKTIMQPSPHDSQPNYQQNQNGTSDSKALDKAGGQSSFISPGTSGILGSISGQSDDAPTQPPVDQPPLGSNPVVNQWAPTGPVPPPPIDDDAQSVGSSVGSQDPRTWISSRSSRRHRARRRGSKHGRSGSNAGSAAGSSGGGGTAAYYNGRASMGSGTAGPLMSQVNQNYGGGHAPSTAGQPGYYNTMAGQYGAPGWGQPGMPNMMQPGLSPGGGMPSMMGGMPSPYGGQMGMAGQYGGMSHAYGGMQPGMQPGMPGGMQPGGMQPGGMPGGITPVADMQVLLQRERAMQQQMQQRMGMQRGPVSSSPQAANGAAGPMHASPARAADGA